MSLKPVGHGFKDLFPLPILEVIAQAFCFLDENPHAAHDGPAILCDVNAEALVLAIQQVFPVLRCNLFRHCEILSKAVIVAMPEEGNR